MPKPSRLRQVIEQSRQKAKRLARDARQNPTSVNVATRRNVVVAGNTGQPDGLHTAVAVQRTSIHQDGED